MTTDATNAAIDITNMALAEEELPSLTDIAQEPSSGAWPDGWYKATIIEGYSTNRGAQFETSDTLSKAGNSRNLLLCMTVQNGAETRNMFGRLNYKLEDFDPQRLVKVKQLREQAKKEKWGNKWPDELKAFQATNLSMGRLGQIEAAVGFRFKRTQAGFINVKPLVGQQVDVHLRLNQETSFSEITEYAKLGDRTNKAAKK